MKHGKRMTALAFLALAGAVLLAPSLAGADASRLSNRDWMRERGKASKKGEWINRVTPVGSRAKLSGLTWTSIPTRARIPAWMKTTVTADGFTNLTGNKNQYTGTQDPYAMLGDATNTTKHAVRYRLPAAQGGGCGGCHGPKGREAAGGDDVVGCKSCHNFRDFTSTSSPNLHATHATLVGGEIPVADPADAGATACNYCHDENKLKGSPGNAACWNCHLSGHRPETPYWNAG